MPYDILLKVRKYTHCPIYKLGALILRGIYNLKIVEVKTKEVIKCQ
jgi:hypothetical protein